MRDQQTVRALRFNWFAILALFAVFTTVAVWHGLRQRELEQRLRNAEVRISILEKKP